MAGGAADEGLLLAKGTLGDLPQSSVVGIMHTLVVLTFSTHFSLRLSQSTTLTDLSLIAHTHHL